MAPDERSAYLLAEAKRRDPERYLCALFAAPDRRDTLLALLLFDDELARVPGAVTQPVAGMIRLQWWRDALDELLAGKSPRRHPVVEALADVLGSGRVAPHALHAMVDAREPALDRPAPDPGWLEAYAAGTGGELARACYAALGGVSSSEAAGAEAMGTAFGMVRLDRAMLMQPEPQVDPIGAERLRALSAEVRARAIALLVEGRRLAARPARQVMPVFLLGTLVDARLKAPGMEQRRSPGTPLMLGLRAWRRRP